MGGMAGSALPGLDGLVHDSAGILASLLLVTAVTEVCPLCLKQTFISGHMRVMTFAAFALADRLMHRSTLKFILGMTLKTDRSGGERYTPSRDQADKKQNQAQATHYLFLPGWQALQLPWVNGVCVTG